MMDRRPNGLRDTPTESLMEVHLKIIEGVDNDDKDNNEEDLIPFILLQNELNLPASMNLEVYY